MKRILFISMLVWQAHCTGAAEKQDRVALVVLWIGATEDANAGSYIRRERSTDKQNMVTLAAEIEADSTIWMEISGEDLNPEFAKRTFNTLSSRSFAYELRGYDRVVLVTMTHIHGLGFMDDPSHAPWILFSPFDNVSVNKSDLISSEAIYDKFRNSGNFDHVLFVNESCNNIGGKNAPDSSLDLPIMKGNSSALSKLILSQRAIFFTSSQYGQYSTVTKFSNVFWEVLNDVSVGRVAPSWTARNGVFVNVSKRTSRITQGKQVPIGFAGDVLSPGQANSYDKGPFRIDHFIKRLPDNSVTIEQEVDETSGAVFEFDN